MKIYLPTCIAVSVLAISATAALGMETQSFDRVSSSQSAISLSESRLNSEKIDSVSFAENQANRLLDLAAKTNSFSLESSDIPDSDLTIKSTNFGQPSYSVTVPIIKF